MKKLSYHTLKELNYRGYLLEDAPERVLQFGEGNFLRAFVERLEEYKTSKGSIRLPYDKPLPLELIGEIAKWCYGTGNHP